MANKTEDRTFGVARRRPSSGLETDSPAGPGWLAVENINPGDDGVTSPIGGLPQQNQPGGRERERERERETENDGCARTSVAARLQGQSVSQTPHNGFG